jgi:very-short-patch-repair endonuclease
VERLAAGQAGVVSRRQVYAAGITRWEVRANLRARRWRTWGSQSLVVFTGPLPDQARRWAAVFEAGPRAFLDGVSALHEAGLQRFQHDVIRVSVPRGARVRRAPGVDIRQTRRWAAEDLAQGPGPPHARVETAAVRAALWARSDRQAALVLTMTVQQGLVRTEAMAVELMRVRRDRRRRLVNAVLLDLTTGVRSLGELDFAAECRRRGLPEPSRQVMRRGRDGRYYLDVFWDDWRVAVEIDGIQHLWAENVVQDALRHNEVTLGGCRVLRLPLLGLRVAPDEFFAQVEQALSAAGCRLRPGA